MGKLKPVVVDAYLCTPGYEGVVREELGREERRADLPGVVVTAPPRRLSDPCFSRQVLPRARLVEATGASELCGAVFGALSDDDARALSSGAALAHVVAPDYLRRGSARPEPHPLASAAERVADVVAKKAAGRAEKKGIARTAAPPARLVQVLVVDAWRAYVSASDLDVADALTSWPSPFPAGRALVAGFDDAPSSAYRKLVEALAWLGRAPAHEDVVLDLGAAPGGWSYVALGLGARVIAFDRADLDERVARHPRLEHVRKDAFEHAPVDEATWLLCDVIDAPERSLALVERALSSPAMKAVVVTMKLKQPVDVGVLSLARRVVGSARGWRGRVKQLVHNKREVTVMLRRG